jgi:hypothetical protein
MADSNKGMDTNVPGPISTSLTHTFDLLSPTDLALLESQMKVGPLIKEKINSKMFC